MDRVAALVSKMRVIQMMNLKYEKNLLQDPKNIEKILQIKKIVVIIVLRLN